MGPDGIHYTHILIWSFDTLIDASSADARARGLDLKLRNDCSSLRSRPLPRAAKNVAGRGGLVKWKLWC